MTAAASAYFWLLVANVVHVYFQFDWHLGARVIFVDRIVYCLSLAAYAAWLCRVAHAPSWAMHALGLTATAALFAIPLDRMVAMPLIWPLQLAILATLLLWTHRAAAGCRFSFAFIALASVAQGVGTLTYFPMCQLAVGGGWVASPGAVYVCDAVFGPLVGSNLFLGLTGLAWAVTACRAVRARVA